MTEGYEAMRAQATGTASGAPRGLALFMSAGLAAWMTVWTAAAASVAPARGASPAQRPALCRGELRNVTAWVSLWRRALTSIPYSLD